MPTGVVQKLEGEYAIVKIERQDMCGDCHACDTVHPKKECTLKCSNQVQSQIGDVVELSLDNERFLKAVYILYGLPLIGFLGGMGLGFIAAQAIGAKSDLLMILGAVAGMLAAFMIIRNRDKKDKYKKMLPQIIEVKDRRN